MTRDPEDFFSTPVGGGGAAPGRAPQLTQNCAPGWSGEPHARQRGPAAGAGRGGAAATGGGGTGRLAGGGGGGAAAG